MESLKSTLSDMTEMFNKKMAEFEAELTSSRSCVSPTNLPAEFNSFKEFIHTALKSIQKQIEFLALSVDKIEMRGRRKMLLVHGIPEEKKENTAQLLVKLVSERLKIKDFTVGDIRRCHRLGRSITPRNPRPIICKFENMSIRNELWFSKTKLKGSGITISEFLTKTRHDAFMAAREKFGMANCWTREGSIHIMCPDGSRQRIVCVSDISSIKLPDISASVKLQPKGRRLAATKK